MLVLLFIHAAAALAQSRAYDGRRAIAIGAELAQRSFGALLPAADLSGLKASVLDVLAPFGDPALNVPEATFDEVDAICKQLEARNPTSAANCVSALEGAWRVRFSDAPPPSNGALGPLRGRAYQIVDVASRTYTNELSLFGGGVKLSLAADFEQPSASKAALRVAFRTLTATLGGVSLPPIQFPTGTERTWLLTYTDDDTRVVRAGVDGGRSTARELGLIAKGEGEAADAYLFVMTRASEAEVAAASGVDGVLTAALDPFVAGSRRRALKAELMQACDEQRLGADTASDSVECVTALIDELAALNPTANPAASAKLCGRWQVAWTTESELLALTKSGFFGLPCEGASQTIQRTKAAASAAGYDYTLSNDIDFDGGFLRVGSTCEPAASGGRVNFRFESCAAKWRQLQVPLPPVGSGWFDVVYLDDELRLCRDIRGDLQVCTRAA